MNRRRKYKKNAYKAGALERGGLGKWNRRLRSIDEASTEREAELLSSSRTWPFEVSKKATISDCAFDGPSSLPSGAASMSVGVKENFEREFSRDFSDVRIYNNEAGSELAIGLKARAFTYGNNIVFNRGEYQPSLESGRQLLRHELVHVVQQRNANTQVVQRAPITRENYPIPKFEFKKGKQVQATRVTGNHVDLSYDPDTGVFTCTFQLYWNFDLSYGAEARKTYKAAFIKTVRDAWEGKFPLVEYEESERGKKVATGRRARVAFAFEDLSLLLPDFKAKDENDLSTQKTRWLSQPENRGVLSEIQTSTRIDVSKERLRDHVRGRMIQLDPDSNDEVTNKASRYKRYGRPKVTTDLDAYFHPPYGEYERQKVPIRFQRGLRSAKQVTSSHEFGHAIGLADEYVLSQGDYNKLKRTRGRKAADTALRQRSRVTDRMMNIGSRVTRDQYLPFAVWLANLTGKKWKVGK